jgi:DNA-binding response OmpR family regulator
MSGFEFLRWLRRESEYHTLPVLVFTRSTFAEDRARVIAEGASGYFVKPADFRSIVEMAESCARFGRLDAS